MPPSPPPPVGTLQGNKVKLVMKFEGRELMFKDQGKDVLLVRGEGHTHTHGHACMRAMAARHMAHAGKAHGHGSVEGGMRTRVL